MSKIKYYILILSLLTIFFNCKSIKPKNTKEANTEIEQHEKIKGLSLTSFNYSIDIEDTKINHDDIYDVKYLIVFKFKSSNNNFKVSYILYDENNNIISSKEKLNATRDSLEKDTYIIQDYFIDMLNYQKINYKITVELNNKKNEYTGSYENLSIPKLTILNIGPIISNYINNKLNVSLSVNLKLLNYKGIRWIHLIPPSQDSYWNITWDVNFLKNEVNVNKIVYEENKNYIENGKYYLQINLNRYGLLQKEIEIIDISGNKDGKNYGLPIINVENIDNKKIQFEILLLDKIDYLELWLFDNNDNENKKIGFAKLKPKNEVYIDYLLTQIKDEDNNTVKIKYNKEYGFKIYSYSKIINGIKYISISDSFILKIKKFKLLPF